MDDKYLRTDNKKRKIKMAPVVIGMFMAAILAVGAVAAVQSSSTQSKQNANFGGLGSAHVHAVFMVKLNDGIIDFSAHNYQVKSPYIHVENGDGYTLHRHAQTVPFSEFLHSVGMDIRNGCFFTDDGGSFCGDGSKTLRTFVNGVEVRSIMDYIPNDGDRILVAYGNNTPEDLANDLNVLNFLEIKTS